MIAPRQNIEKLKTEVLRHYSQASSYRQALDDRLVRWFKLYRSAREDRPESTTKEWQGANIKVPEIWAAIETITPRLAASVLAARPFVAVLPRTPEFEQQAAIMESLLDYQLNERVAIRQKMGTWARNACIYGYGPAKVTWRTEKRTVTVKMPDLSEDLLRQAAAVLKVNVRHKMVQIETMAYDDPWLDLIDVLDFWWDPAGLTVDQCLYVIQRSRVSMSYLERMAEQGVYENIKDVKPKLRLGADSRRAERLVGLGLDDMEPDPDEPMVELLEHWRDDRVVVLANQDTVIRAEPNPFWHGRKPFVVPHLIPSGVSLAGVSLIEAAESSQVELNSVRNLRLDNAVVAANKVWTVLDSVQIDPGALVLKPAGFVPVPTHDVIREIPIADIRPSLYEEERLLKDDIQKATGAYDTMRGAPAPRRATATEIAGRMEQGMFRFQDMRANLEHTGLLPAVELMGALDQQYIDQTRLIRVVGRAGLNWIPVQPEAIMGQFDYMYLGSATEPIANRDLRRQQLLQLYTIVAANPLIRHDQFLRILLQAFEIKNPDRFMQELQPQQQQEVASPLEQAFGPAQGGGGPAPAEPQPGLDIP